jgi:glycosyltransferase involved in cell wall biosynthesis
LAKTRHQLYPTLRTRAFEAFDFTDFDAVVSSSSAEAKGILTRPETLHICYCHTPTRYYWSDYAGYRRSPGFGVMGSAVTAVMPRVTQRMRLWDFAAAQRVDAFIANSITVQRRIAKFYRRPSVVINPPIDIGRFSVNYGRRKGFVVISRLIPYKRVDLAVRACTDLRLPLTVIGEGSEMRRLRAMAGPTIRFAGRLWDELVSRALAEAQALIFTAEEDFGLVPLEAMACGTPVVAYRKGGATETVIEGKTGCFFESQDVESLKECIQRFMVSDEYDRATLRRHAERYDEAIFVSKIRQFVRSKLSNGSVAGHYPEDLLLAPVEAR